MLLQTTKVLLSTPQLVLVVDWEEQSAIFDSKLGDDCNRPKNLAMTSNVVAVDLGENPPGRECDKNGCRTASPHWRWGCRGYLGT